MRCAKCHESGKRYLRDGVCAECTLRAELEMERDALKARVEELEPKVHDRDEWQEVAMKAAAERDTLKADNARLREAGERLLSFTDLIGAGPTHDVWDAVRGMNNALYAATETPDA